jgi:hypothetical protein
MSRSHAFGPGDFHSPWRPPAPASVSTITLLPESRVRPSRAAHGVVIRSLMEEPAAMKGQTRRAVTPQ